MISLHVGRKCGSCLAQILDRKKAFHFARLVDECIFYVCVRAFFKFLWIFLHNVNFFGCFVTCSIFVVSLCQCLSSIDKHHESIWLIYLILFVVDVVFFHSLSTLYASTKKITAPVQIFNADCVFFSLKQAKSNYQNNLFATFEKSLFNALEFSSNLLFLVLFVFR